MKTAREFAEEVLVDPESSAKDHSVYAIVADLVDAAQIGFDALLDHLGPVMVPERIKAQAKADHPELPAELLDNPHILAAVLGLLAQLVAQHEAEEAGTPLSW